MRRRTRRGKLRIYPGLASEIADRGGVQIITAFVGGVVVGAELRWDGPGDHGGRPGGARPGVACRGDTRVATLERVEPRRQPEPRLHDCTIFYCRDSRSISKEVQTRYDKRHQPLARKQGVHT